MSARSIATGSVVSIMIGALTTRIMLLVEAIYVIELFAVGVLQIHIEDLRAAFDLLAGDLGGFFVFLFGDQAFEFARADFVGALADDQRALVVAGFDKIDA